MKKKMALAIGCLLALFWFAPRAQADTTPKTVAPATTTTEEQPASPTAPCATNERSVDGVCSKVLATRRPAPTQPADDDDDDDEGDD